MENIWGIMTDKLNEGKLPKSKDALKRRIRRIWNDIAAETFRNCSDGMRDRLREVIATSGDALKK